MVQENSLDLQKVVLACMESLNLARDPDEQLTIDKEAPIFGQDSPLDSLGLVSLLIDIEDALADEEVEISLSDEKAMSQRHSPYRDVPTLVAYINSQLEQESAT
ncbi:MAG: hypothetical protein COA78_35640 [Blastopirellula sp.]|nr:MAG: hypothetical protein COA78_35640 [Blastopirellula sp.]